MSHIGLAERLAIETGIYRRDTIAEIARKIGALIDKVKFPFLP